MLDAIEICSTPNPAASVLWLHGLGADGNDFVPVVEELALPDVRFVLPHASAMPVTVNGGYVMPAWYDIFTLDIAGDQDEAGIRAAEATLAALVARELSRGVAAERIVLAGFSQGGAVALQTALRYPQPLAGVLALSTYLPLAGMLASEKNPANAGLPVFIAHGNEDAVIPLQAALMARESLEREGYTVEWQAYPMEHSVCRQEVDDIRRFLLRVLN